MGVRDSEEFSRDAVAKSRVRAIDILEHGTEVRSTREIYAMRNWSHWLAVLQVRLGFATELPRRRPPSRQRRLQLESLDEDVPLDALTLINEINKRTISDAQGGLPTSRVGSNSFFDVDGDGYLAPLDVLSIVNHLNGISAGARAEGEPPPSEVVTPHTARFFPTTSASALSTADDSSAKSTGSRPPVPRREPYRVGRFRSGANAGAEPVAAPSTKRPVPEELSAVVQSDDARTTFPKLFFGDSAL